jgi:hypothetical protein
METGRRIGCSSKVGMKTLKSAQANLQAGMGKENKRDGQQWAGRNV